MRYTLIELRKHVGEWGLTISPDEADRESEEKEPHSLGFYYAPRRHTVQTSFTRLRKSLIKDRRQMVETLQREIDELESFELPPNVPKRPSTGISHQFKGAK